MDCQVKRHLNIHHIRVLKIKQHWVKSVTVNMYWDSVINQLILASVLNVAGGSTSDWLLDCQEKRNSTQYNSAKWLKVQHIKVSGHHCSFNQLMVHACPSRNRLIKEAQSTPGRVPDQLSQRKRACRQPGNHHMHCKGQPRGVYPKPPPKKRGRERRRGGLGAEGKITGYPSTGAGHGGSLYRHACANPGRWWCEVESQ